MDSSAARKDGRPGPLQAAGGSGEPDLASLKAQIRGEVDASRLTRAQYSTDASNYRVLPQAVIFPRDADDVRAAIAWAKASGVPITARGGGTSCAGNAIGPGVVLEFSRHMTAILDIDPQRRLARVQPGVILSDLQAAAGEFGLRFGPDPSTLNRATIGGMIGNNACGPHAVAWGRTSDNVHALTMIDGRGRTLEFSNEDGAELSGASAGVGAALKKLADTHLAEIRRGCGQFSRQVSGYSLEHLLPENKRNIAAFMVGTEATLGIVTEATVRLVPLPTAPTVLALGYPDMPSAADDVPAILRHHPLAIEGLDAQLVDVVRRHKGDHAVPALPEGGGWLLVEVSGEDEADAAARARALAGDTTAGDWLIVPPGPQAVALWKIRADGAGLGGRTPAGDPAWPGFEDSAVPPARLGDYLRDLTKLMESHSVAGLMYGHFGDGCMHVRLDLPLETPEGVARARAFLEAGADLVARYGGSISGEHGDGRARSELLARTYPKEIIEIYGQVKAIFDPDGLLNPGVLVDPAPLDADLRRPWARPLGNRVDGVKRRADAAPTTRDQRRQGFGFWDDDGDFTRAVHRCTGVGKCRAANGPGGGFMCPSYQATGKEKDVTRGRARALQEVARGDFLTGFSDPALWEALDLCLSCKACGAECPTGVDVAQFKSEALFRRFAGKLRPRTHYSLGMLPRWASLVTASSLVARLVNYTLAIKPVGALAMWAAGVDRNRSLPPFATERFSRWARGAGLTRARAGEEARAGGDGRPQVLLWADSFSETLDSSAARATAGVLEQAGYRVILPEESPCCGLTWISTGQLAAARRRAQNLTDQLWPYAQAGIPVVGVEPSCTATVRSDIPELMADPTYRARAQEVAENCYTLAELLTAPPPIGPGERWAPPDLSGMEVVAQPHCHHHSVMGWESDAALLRSAGAKLTQLAGCCGLAGNFGMEAGHYEISQKVAALALLPALEKAGKDAVFLADGFSCRTQAQQLAGRSGQHLAELLLHREDAQFSGEIPR